MNISLKSMKIVHWLVTANFFLGIMLVLQLRPETYTWRLATLQIMFYIIGTGLYFYVFRIFGKVIIADSLKTYKPRFNSRIKNQLRGLLNRTISGAIGLGFVAVFLPLSTGAMVITVVVYGMVVIGAFFNDGRRYDQFDI